MAYFITQNKSKAGESIQMIPGTPLHIKVPSRDFDAQPFLSFASKELAEKFMEIRSISIEEFRVASIHNELASNYKENAAVLFENENQILEMNENAEGYDYESLIHQYAF